MNDENLCTSCSNEDYSIIPIPRIIDKLNRLFANNELDAVGGVLEFWDNEARNLSDKRALLEILNEEIGYFRRTGEKENGLKAVDEAIQLIDELGVESLASSATIYLNAATTMKAFGQAVEAMPYFQKAKSIYESTIDPNDYRMAALYNNMSSSYKDLGELQNCEECCHKAIEILKHNEGCLGEIAVTLINLAHLYHDTDPFDERIYEMMDKAWECLTSEENELDGNFAFLCSKCYPSFGFFGYFEKESELIRLIESIYEGN